IVVVNLSKMRTATLANALGIALSTLILIAPWSCSNSLSDSLTDTASRIQAKIAQVGASATKLRESGADISPIQEAMQQVDKLLQSGKIKEAEKILDSLIANPGAPAISPAPAAVALAEGRDCDPQQPMTVSSSVTVDEDCTVGGD